MRFLALLLICFLAMAVPTHAGLSVSAKPERIALVVGVSDYENIARLRNPNSDARLVAASLDKLGFKIDLVLDPTLDELMAAIDRHVQALAGTKAISVFYYSGHGVQVEGANYLIARDAEIRSPDDLKKNAVALDALLAKTANANIDGINMFLLDASRDNPFPTSTRSNPSRGLAPVLDTPNTFVIFSTGPGEIALDGDGDNSPFALAVAAALDEQDLDATDLFRVIRNRVVDATGGRQVPFMADTLVGSLILNEAGAKPRLEDEPPEARSAKVIYEKSPGVYAASYEDGSYALLVGVSDYDQWADGLQAWRDLPAVADEITRLAKVLKEVHGFEVETLLNPSGDELEAALESFVNRNGAKPNARLVFAMSGHGATTESFGKKVAWFVPRDAPTVTPPAPFRNTALNLRRVEEWSETMEAKHVLWIFDSCFSGAAIRMIEQKGATETDDGWSAHLLENPVRRVITAGSEDQEVPAKSRFMDRLIDVLSGSEPLGDGTIFTGKEVGDFLRKDLIRYTYKQGLPDETPQNDTIVIPGEEGDVVFRLEPELAASWENQDDAAQ